MLLTNCFFAVRMFNNLYIIIFLNKFFIPRHTLRRTNHERIGEHQQEIRDRSHHHTNGGRADHTRRRRNLEADLDAQGKG